MFHQRPNPYPAKWLQVKGLLGMTRNDWGLALLLAVIIAIACTTQWSWLKFWVFGPV